MIYLDVTSSCKSRLNTGVQRVVRGIARALPERGHSIEPLLWSPSHGSYCRLSTEERENLALRPGPDHPDGNPEAARNPHPWSKSLRWVSQGLRKISLADKLTASDILLVPEIFQDSRTDFFRELAIPPGAELAAVFYDALGWSLQNYDTANDRSRLGNYLKALGIFDRVFPISRESEEDLHRYWEAFGIRPARTTTIPLPMPLGEPRPAGRENFSAKKILCVASLEDRKNHLILLESCERLWSRGLSFQLQLVGRSIPGKSDPILARIDELQKKERPLVWLRHIEDSVLAEAYAGCSFTVFPSVREGFGLPILESLWHGRPCICGNNGALGEAAGGGGCHFVRQTDPEELARGMEDLLENRSLYEQLYREALSRTFRSWQDYASDLEACFGNQTKTAPRQPPG